MRPRNLHIGRARKEYNLLILKCVCKKWFGRSRSRWKISGCKVKVLAAAINNFFFVLARKLLTLKLVRLAQQLLHCAGKNSFGTTVVTLCREKFVWHNSCYIVQGKIGFLFLSERVFAIIVNCEL